MRGGPGLRRRSPQAEKLRSEWVVRIDGKVRIRPAGTENAEMPTGQVEVYVTAIEVLGPAGELPMPVAGAQNYPEDIRLKYRFLDLRREKLHANIMLRGQVIDSMRARMKGQGFFEFQTPILTASSPEGARDYLVPSRVHPGKFYALPQAPQQFKQLIMVAGFDRYFQIAPCFRDEDARADRSPGRVLPARHRDELCDAAGRVRGRRAGAARAVRGVRRRQAPVTQKFPTITYADAMLKYGSDKPDLRNPILIVDVTDEFAREEVTFKAFKGVIARGGVVRAIPAPGAGAQPRSFFDKLNDWARGEGAPGLGYVIFEGEGDALTGKGPIAKFIPDAGAEGDRRQGRLQGRRRGVLFLRHAGQGGEARRRRAAAHRQRARAHDVRHVRALLDRRLPDVRVERGRQEDRLLAQPFSMPQMEHDAFLALDHADEATILGLKAYQYDIVCNGVELSSGAIRNHRPDTMKQAFALAGYDESVLEERFGGMYRAFQYGAPPHGGIAPGVDRIVMLLAGEENLREIVLFPMNQRAEDLLMGAPNEATPKQLRELHIRLNLPETKKPADGATVGAKDK